MKVSQVLCVVGKSFARIFGRNAIDAGMPALVNPGPLPALPEAIVMAGGLVPWVKAQRPLGAAPEL